MSAKEVLEALQIINGGIDGVATAPLKMPGSIQPRELPLVLSYPSEATATNASFRHLQEPREWIIRLYVREVGAGRGWNAGFHEALGFLARFRDEYTTQGHTDNDAWDCLDYLGDGGVTQMGLHGNTMQDTARYWTVEFRVEVTTFVASEA